MGLPTYCVMRLEMMSDLIYSVRPCLRAEEIDIELPCSKHLWQTEFVHTSDLVPAVLEELSAFTPRFVFPDVLRIALNDAENLPPLDHFTHELLISALQDTVWSVCHEREQVAIDLFKFSIYRAR